MDLIGNVWEWVEDDYHDTYTGAPVNGAAWIDSPRGANRILRGGAFNNNMTDYLRASVRVSMPIAPENVFGFRRAW
jgi:formylglycine-generating enzyme required for sulfatase activity